MAETLGEYTIEHVLGEGGFGCVYAARREDDEVALKVLREDLDLTDSERARFEKEASTLAALRHPSIVELVDHGELDDGRPFIAMRRLRGDVLVDRIEGAPLSVAEAHRFFGQLADAVTTMHEAGLVHRDIKPENVMLVDDDERAVLLDLGIAKGVSEGPSTTTQAGRVRGTPAYMAPERFYGTPASEQSDLYELALVYYMMLLGRLPWADGADPSARHHPAAPVNAGFAKSLSDALLDALSVDAKRRPPSVRAFARRIERATKEQQLASETTAAQPVVDAPAPVPVDEPVPSRGAVTPDNTPPGASAIKAQEQEPPRWRAPLFAALGAAALATIPWLWTSQRQAEQLASMTTALERTSSAQPVEPHDALPPPVPSDVQAAPKAETTAAEATPSAVASAVEPPARPAVSVAPPPPSTQPSGPGAPAASLNVQPLGPEGAPPPPAPWCDRYISLWCSPDAKAWSPTGCATARSVVAKNGKIFARLPNKSSHDRICKRQYEAQKGFVTEGIAGHKERMAKRKEQK